MEDPPSRVLIYLMRHDIRLSDNPIFHAASASLLKRTPYTKPTESIDTQIRDDLFVQDQELPFFTHLLPVYVFPANQVEVSGFVSDPMAKSPYPQAQSQVAGLWRTGHHRAKFMAEGLWDLKERLERLGCGSSLHIRVGRPGEVVEDMIKWYVGERDAGRSKIDVVGIWMIAEEGKDEKDEEARITRVATQSGAKLRIWNDEKYYIDECVLHISVYYHGLKLISYSQDQPLNNIDDLPNVFTTYRKSLEPLRARPRPCIPTPKRLPPLPDVIPPQKHPFDIPNTLDGLLEALLQPLNDDPRHGLSMPPTWPSGVSSSHPFSGGETAAHDRLTHLISSGAMSSYKETRNQMLGVDYSTKLSAFLAQGE